MRVVENTETPMPAVSLAEITAPVRTFKSRIELALIRASDHQLIFWVVHILIVVSPLLEDIDLACRLAKFFAQGINRPVIISIFQGTSHVLSDTDIIRYITQFIILLVSDTTGSRSRQLAIRVMLQGFPKRLDIVSSQAFDISVSYHGSGVIADHAIPVARTCPFRQETALFISVHQTFLHLLVHLRIHQVQEGEKTAECIPETGIGKHIARQDLTVIRAIMHDLPFGIDLIEATREKQGTIQARIESTQVIDVRILYLDLT